MVGWTYCYVLDACESARDFDRASQWIERAFEAVREFGIEFTSPAHAAAITWDPDVARRLRRAPSARSR